MITKAIDTEQIKQSTDLRELAARYTELRKETAQSLCGPCPKCGGTDRFWVKSDHFACRQCNPNGGDAIAFFMWKDGVDFKSAVATITNAPAPTVQPTKRTPKRPEAQPAEWQQRAMARVNEAHRRLLDDDDQQAQAGRAYLLGRGLDPYTWKAFKLGFTPSASLPGTEGKQTAPGHCDPLV
jgi:DNA primase